MCNLLCCNCFVGTFNALLPLWSIVLASQCWCLFTTTLSTNLPIAAWVKRLYRLWFVAADNRIQHTDGIICSDAKTIELLQSINERVTTASQTYQ